MEGARRFSVAQIEELGFGHFWEQKEAVRNALEEYCAANGYFFSALLVSDVVRQTSLLLVAGDPRFTGQINYEDVEPGIYELPGVVSRKKQLLPFLTQCLKDMG